MCLLFLREFKMTWQDYLDNPSEIFIGACLQFPLYFIVGCWVLPIMGLCGLLWRAGGVRGGSKLFRRLGVPLVACGACFLASGKGLVFLAVPFMVWLAPSYGEDSWLYKWLKNDFLTRLICFAWYYGTFSIAFCF